MVGSVVLFFLFRQIGWMPQLGIAVATSLGGWLNAYLLWSTLRRRGDFAADDRLRRNLPLIGLASVAMGAALYAAAGYFAPYLQPDRGFLIEATALAVLVLIGSAVFAAAILGTGVMSPAQLGRFTRR